MVLTMVIGVVVEFMLVGMATSVMGTSWKEDLEEVCLGYYMVLVSILLGDIMGCYFTGNVFVSCSYTFT